jgi:hypothetical protein
LRKALEANGGSWTEQCDSIMAANPRHLLAFDVLRDLMARVFGDSRVIINPLQCVCLKCEQTLALRHPNSLANFIYHLKTHKDDPFCACAVKRLKLAWGEVGSHDTSSDDEKHRRGERLIAVSRLDREAGELPPLCPPPQPCCKRWVRGPNSFIDQPCISFHYGSTSCSWRVS